MRLLFFKRTFAWPRSSGHDVHCFYMMQALASLGHEIGLVTLQPSAPQALAGLPLALHQTLDQAANGGSQQPRAPEGAASAPAPATPTLATPAPAAGRPNTTEPRLTWLQERFRSYFGVDRARLAALAALIERFGADAFIAGGLDVLPYFPAARGTVSVWYAADELAWHHLSLVQARDRRTWPQAKEAALKATYERAFRGAIDRAWVVSPVEARAMRWLGGMRAVDVVPNGVDTTHYQPLDAPEAARTAVFWGRLDFEPNVQALEWFCRDIWPHVHQAHPDARFTIIGFQPADAVKALAGQHNITLLPDVPDIRPEVARQAVVVLPFVSGGGIKNKLLEAASLGKAVVCTPRTCSGLRQAAAAPFRRATTPQEWLAVLGDLWEHPETRRQVGTDARAWVLAHHTWTATAAEAIAGLRESLRQRDTARTSAQR